MINCKALDGLCDCNSYKNIPGFQPINKINDVMCLLIFVCWMASESPEGVSCKVSDCGSVGSGVPKIDLVLM